MQAAYLWLFHEIRKVHEAINIIFANSLYNGIVKPTVS